MDDYQTLIADPENWDGIPFLDELTDKELLERINTLEANA